MHGHWQTLAEWATLYLHYVGIVRKLDEAYDQARLFIGVGVVGVCAG